MADNNVIKFRRVEKKPTKPDKPTPQAQQAPRGPKLPANQLSLIAWAAIIGAATSIVQVQQSGSPLSVIHL